MAEVTREISVNASLERVFNAISTTEGISGWWTEDCAYDGRLGGKGQLTFGNPPVALALETMIFSRDEEVLLRCLNGPADWMGTNISWVVEPLGERTRLILNHAGIRITDSNRPVLDSLWRELLDSLKRYVESGKPAPVYRTS